jgi:3',5'-cyclic AMP phosphodiesterase CpdA
MKLFAISDLHVGHPQNRVGIANIAPHPDDWLILAGDVGETVEHLELVFDVLSTRFSRLVWVPGNHELWAVPSRGASCRGDRKYRQLVDVCRRYNVLCPEDPYPVVTFGLQRVRLAPLFLLYDYSFRPPGTSLASALGWAASHGVVCADEHLLHTEPYADVVAWCNARCDETESRLQAATDGTPTVLINHFPLRRDLVWLPAIPQFAIWCGTERTRDWHQRFNARVVVSGHLHIRSTTYRHGVRFEEVSLGYPRQWVNNTTPDRCLKEILG